MSTDPIALFGEWFKEAHNPQELEPTAMSLATVSAQQLPSCRIVLLKHFDHRGFVFYTNFTSRKAAELSAQPAAALCFHWKSLEKQVRIEGVTAKVSDREADQYFATRPRESQMGAWASKQSQQLDTQQTLEERFNHYQEEFAGKEVPRPPFWGGFRLVPTRIEFWLKGDFRIHTRRLFEQKKAGWSETLLYP
jgi:pyridoxamine 5'-phosphate oxidase